MWRKENGELTWISNHGIRTRHGVNGGWWKDNIIKIEIFCQMTHAMYITWCVYQKQAFAPAPLQIWSNHLHMWPGGTFRKMAFKGGRTVHFSAVEFSQRNHWMLDIPAQTGIWFEIVIPLWAILFWGKFHIGHFLNNMYDWPLFFCGTCVFCFF